MKITALGTNGWFDTETGQTMCTLIQQKDYSIILDAGYGIRKIQGLVDFSKPIYLFLTHLHYDHTVGLHTMDLYPFELPLKIFLPAGEKDAFFQMGRSPYTSDWTKAAAKGIEVFDSNEFAQAGLPFSVTALPLQHPVPDMGYRFEIDGKVIAYLSDTGFCDNCVTLARGADLAIAECGALPGMVKPFWPHMEPEICAKLAVQAEVKQMMLTHFSAALYPTIAARKQAVDLARPIFEHLITGVDNLEITL